ncbi:hypothetical protein FACS1894181_00520 [Bacteroidia bacterium]|nr:hypothetical protein FACS1894181_00520 [Bacteroidia bacterium]
MNNRITIGDLSALLAQATGKDNESVERFLREFVAVVDEGLFADRLVKVNSIGTFKIIQVEKRESIDVNTKERIVIPEHYKLSFTPDKEMNKTVNKPFEAFETIQIEEGVDVSTLGTLQEVKEEEIDDDSDSYEYEEVKEIAQEASGSDNFQVIVKDDVPPLPVVEEVIPLPEPDERIITPIPTLEEETVLLLEEETENIPVFEPPMSSSPPPPPPPPPEDSPPFEEWEEPEEPEGKPKEELPSDDLDELSNSQYREKETGDYYFTEKETEKYLETEEDMESYNGNRRKPGPVPYPGESGRGPMNNNVWAVILAAVIVVLVIVLAFLMLKPTKTNSELSAKKNSNEISNSELEFPPSRGHNEDIDDIGIGGFIDEEAAPKTYPDFRPVPEKNSGRKSSSSSSNTKAAPYVAQTSVTTKQGDRLNLIALNYYGDKVFWVYIYLVNQSKLNNPDVLPVGVTLTVPSSKDYDINPHSRLSLRKAYALQRDILNNAKASGTTKSNGSSSYPSNGGYDSYGGGQNGYGNDQYGGGFGDGQNGYGNDQYGGDQYGDGQSDYGNGDQYGDGGQDDFGIGSDFSDDGGYGDGVNLKAKPNNNKKAATTKPAKTKTTPAPANAKGNTKQQSKSQSSTSQKSASGRYL